MPKRKPPDTVIYCPICTQLGHYASACPTVPPRPDPGTVVRTDASYVPPVIEDEVFAERLMEQPDIPTHNELWIRVEALEARVQELEKRKQYMRDYQRKKRSKKK